jgi:hypothetical protein
MTEFRFRISHERTTAKAERTLLPPPPPTRPRPPAEAAFCRSSTSEAQWWPCSFFVSCELEMGGPLFCLDICRANNLAPFFCFVGDELVEIARRTRERHTPHIGKPRLDLGIGESCIGLPVEGFDYI